MKILAPVYYDDFSCIASECKHSCCIGWEIDIDEETNSFYKTLGGEIGERLKHSISADETPHFLLSAGERCPFLNENGLCDIIISCGESALCDICADHPRFRNFYSDRTEIGLGLCCEAAAKIIVESKKSFELAVIDEYEGSGATDEDEKELIELRNIALDIVKDRNFTIAERTERLLNKFSTRLPPVSPSEWSAFFRSLERLDCAWDSCLDSLAEKDSLSAAISNEIAAENLLCYFIYRHFPAALYDGELASKVAFSVLSCKVIFTLSAEFGLEEAARMYSSEIEYSDENLDKIFDFLYEADIT